MKHYLSLFFLLYSFFSFSQKNRDYVFESRPAFFSGFLMTIKKDTLSCTLGNINYYILDSLSNKYEGKIYYKGEEKLSNIFVDKIVCKIVLNKKTRNEIVTNLERIECNHDLDIAAGVNYDAISFVLKKGNENKKYIYDKISKENYKAIIDIINILTKLYHDNSAVIRALENTKRMMGAVNPIEIKNSDPLLVKMFFTRDCDSLEKDLILLPKKDEIYVDLLDYIGIYDDCVIELFYKYYKHVRWIKRDFDVFNSYERGIRDNR